MLSVGIGMTQKGWYNMMTTLYGVYKWEGIRKVLKAAFADEAEAQEILMNLFFEYSFELFNYFMQQEDVYWYCGGEKWRDIKSEVEVALECARDLESDFFIEEFPAFI